MIHYITTHGIGNAWVAAEFQEMEKRNIPCVLHSLYKPYQHFFGSERVARIDRETRLLYPISTAGLVASVALAPLLFGLAFWSALANAFFGPRESFRHRCKAMYHLLVACHWARGLRREEVSVIHAQWVHSAGTVAMYAAWLLRKPFSFTGHAADLFRDRVALVDKVRRAEFIVCISEFHRRLYLSLGARPDRLHLVYCGIDTSQFEFQERVRERRRIISVGRLVEKKGLDVLLEACSLLKTRGVPFQCVLAGNGPESKKLQARAAKLGLAHEVLIADRPIPQEMLPEVLATADVYAQPCVWSSDNDVDGTPRTLMEAMATGLPSVASRIAGLPDLVANGEAGLLVEPGDPVALADAIERLLTDDELARRLGRAGRALVEREFDLTSCLDPLVELFRAYLPQGRQPGESDDPIDIPLESVA